MFKKIVPLVLLIVIVFISGCLVGQDGGGVLPWIFPSPPTKAELNVKLVHILSPTDYVVVEGMVPIDLTNMTNSWIKTDTGINRIKENSSFVSRFELKYPMGLPAYNDVNLLIKASSRKIEGIGIVNQGYNFKGIEPGTLLNEEVNVYKYQFAQIKEGDTMNIIFAGKTKSIGTSVEDKTPIFVSLTTQDGANIASGNVEITIYREQT